MRIDRTGSRDVDRSDDLNPAREAAPEASRAHAAHHPKGVKEPGKPGPVLGSATARLDKPGVVSIAFEATAPGADFAAKNRESTAVSIYVDGKYHASEAIFAEHGKYRVN